MSVELGRRWCAGREGARRMLAAALEAEVDGYLAEHRDQDGRCLAVCNGYRQPRQVATSAGTIEVRAPRVNDKRIDPDTAERKRFSSADPAAVGAQVSEDR